MMPDDTAFHQAHAEMEKNHAYNHLSRLKTRLEEIINPDTEPDETCQALRSLLYELEEILEKIEIGERDWQSVFDAVHDPIFLHDEEFRIIRANKAYARKSGIPIREIIGKFYWDVFPKGNGPLPQCHKMVEQRNENHNEEITLNNGEIILSRGFVVHDINGRYMYSVHIMQDVTEKRRLQMALEESANRYQSLFEDAPDAIFLADTETGQLIDANPAAERLVGRSRKELLSLNQSQLHPEYTHSREIFTNHIQACLSNTAEPLSEIPVLHADGHIIMTEITARVFQLNGRTVIQGVFRDITARKAAEDKLNEAHNKLSMSLNLIKGILESVPIRIFWKDHDLKYLGCNTLFARDAGISHQDELIGKTDFDLSWKDQAKDYQEDDLRVMNSGISKLGYEEPQTTPEGTTIWLRTSKVPLHDDNQQVIGVLGIYDDITRQKQSEQDLQLSESRLKEAQEVAHLGSWELDLVKNELWWSDENYRIFGVEPGGPDSSNTYETFLNTVHPEDREYVNIAYQGSVENRTPYEIEHRLLMKDGVVKWVYERCITYYAEDGTPLRSTGTTLDITQQRKAEERLRHSETGLTEAQRIAKLGNWEYDIVRDTMSWSDEIYHIFEMDPKQHPASYNEFITAIHPNDRAKVNRAFSESVKNKYSDEMTHRIGLPDGRIKYVRELYETHYDENDKPVCTLGTMQDITQQYSTELALSHSNRALKAISSCNSILMHASSENELYNNMCKVIIEEGGYCFAWIGLVKEDKEKYILPVAHAGLDEGYLHMLPLSYDEGKQGCGPAGLAIRAGQTSVVHDTLTDPNFANWRSTAIEHGFRSVLALPLKNNEDTVFAILCIYAEESNSFDNEAIELMEELATDIAFGTHSLRTRDERDHYLQEHQKSDERYKQALVDTIRAIALTVEKRDPYTAGHQMKVAELSVAIGREMGMNEDRLEGLRLGAMIHDIGKIYVPAEILNRPGRLSRAEFEIIQAHAEVGYDIIKDVQFPWPVADMVIQHHERMDGSGYPKGLKGDAIIPEARILAVADVVEAITSHRPYRPAVGLDKALLEIEAGSGTRYDPVVAEACLKLIRDKGFNFEQASKE